MPHLETVHASCLEGEDLSDTCLLLGVGPSSANGLHLDAADYRILAGLLRLKVGATAPAEASRQLHKLLEWCEAAAGFLERRR